MFLWKKLSKVIYFRGWSSIMEGGGGQLMIINACKIWYLPKNIFSVRLIYQVTYYFNIRVHRIKQSMPVFIYSLLNVLVFVRKQLL